MNFETEIIIKLEDLMNFIYRSKKVGFALSDKKTCTSDGTSIYSNRELPWLYNDIYCGNTVERGFEDVHYDMVLIWSMQYRGGVIEEFFDNEKYNGTAEVVSAFLKHALMELPISFPIRGPKYFELNQVEHEGIITKGEFIYTNRWSGDIKKFVGHEVIKWNGREVYYHDYIGGIVRNRYFPSVIV